MRVTDELRVLALTLQRYAEDTWPSRHLKRPLKHVSTRRTETKNEGPTPARTHRSPYFGTDGESESGCTLTVAVRAAAEPHSVHLHLSASACAPSRSIKDAAPAPAAPCRCRFSTSLSGAPLWLEPLSAAPRRSQPPLQSRGRTLLLWGLRFGAGPPLLSSAACACLPQRCSSARQWITDRPRDPLP